MARKSVGSTSVKRARSTSSDISDLPEVKPVIKNGSAASTPRKPRASKTVAAAKNADALEEEDKEEDEDEEDEKPLKKAKKSPGKKKVMKDEDVDAAVEENGDMEEIPKKGKGKGKSKAQKAEVTNGDNIDEVEEKPKKKPKAKAFPPPDLDPSSHPSRQGYPVFRLPPLTVPPNGGIGSKELNGTRPMLLGAHVSIAGGPATALLRAGKAGANGLALFLKSQRQWKSNPYEDETIQRFKDYMKPIEQGGEYQKCLERKG